MNLFVIIDVDFNLILFWSSEDRGNLLVCLVLFFVKLERLKYIWVWIYC